MPKLHELLAVESNLKGQADKTRGELMASFDKKRHLFHEKVVTFHPVEEGKAVVREEQLDLNTTVRKELSWISDFLVKAWDTSLAVARANTLAKAEIVVDGNALISDLPATALLELEKRVGEVKNLVEAIPTLDPAKGFTLDANRGANIFRAREEVRPRTQKKVRPLVLYEATKEHPAQVKEISEDIVIGHIHTQEWSGLITPAEKADMIDRCEKLQRAVKQARARANDQKIEIEHHAAVLLKYVFG